MKKMLPSRATVTRMIIRIMLRTIMKICKPPKHFMDSVNLWCEFSQLKTDRNVSMKGVKTAQAIRFITSRNIFTGRVK